MHEHVHNTCIQKAKYSSTPHHSENKNKMSITYYRFTQNVSFTLSEIKTIALTEKLNIRNIHKMPVKHSSSTQNRSYAKSSRSWSHEYAARQLTLPSSIRAVCTCCRFLLRANILVEWTLTSAWQTWTDWLQETEWGCRFVNQGTTKSPQAARHQFRFSRLLLSF